jgi:hypothetical protein
MTTPQRPLDTATGTTPGWDDDRLGAAFEARAARAVVPVDLAAVTVERLRPTVRRSPWTRLLPAGAALVLVLAVVGGGIAVLGGPAGLLGSGAVTFRDGPTPDLRTLDGAEYALDFPASWLAYTATSAGASGGSIDAVLTTQPIEERCNGLMGVDINCVYEQRLEPGQLRIFVGSGSYRAQTVLDRADIENGSTTRLAVGGMPAILDEFDDAPDDYYLADQSATWAVATPTSLDRVIRIEFMAREPAVDAARAAVEALVASFRFTPPPAPLPADPEAAAAAARAALDDETASFRQGFVPAADTDGQTYLDCLPDAPGEDQVVGIDYGPGGDLGWTVLTRCRWSVDVDKNGPFWRIDTLYEWTVGEAFGRYRETYWLDAAGVVVSRASEGDVPPAGDPSRVPGEATTSTTVGPDGTALISLGQAGDPGQRDVQLVDRTGALLSARPASEWELGSAVGDIPDGTVRLIQLPDGGVLVRWDGGLCDDAFVLEVDAIDGGRTPDRVTLYGDRGGTCRAMKVAWGITLDFDGDVDVASMVGRNFVGAAVAPPTDPPTAAPTELFGLEVIDVEAALEIQALPDDDREIAVRGWSWRLDPAMMLCFDAAVSEGDQRFVGDDCGADSLMATAAGSLDATRLELVLGGAMSSSLPFDSHVEVVVVGHFDDRRSSGCSAGMLSRCAEMFWVDAVWRDGALMPRDWAEPVRGGDPATHTHDDAWERVRGPDEDPLIALSIGQITGSALQRLEPASNGVIPLERWNWHITAYEPSSGRLRTFVIPDSVLDDIEGVVSYEVIGDEVGSYFTIID